MEIVNVYGVYYSLRGCMNNYENMLAKILASNEEKAKLDGRQKYPHSKIKVGASLYKVDVSEWDDNTTTIAIDEWIVRSIRRKRGTQTRIGKLRISDAYGDSAPVYVNVSAKIKGATWVRQSRKVNDFGWSKNIPQYYKVQFEVGNRLPLGLFTTKLAALKWALKDKEKWAVKLDNYRKNESDETELAEWDEEIVINKKSIRLLKSRIKKMTNTKDRK